MKYKMLILVCVLILACMPASVQAHDENIVEMTRMLDEIISTSDEIHDQSAYIADDEEPTVGLDWRLMGKAEIVHGVSHEIEGLAEIMQARLNEGMATGDFDEEEITRRMTMLYGVTHAISGLIDDIENETPESHRAYADTLSEEYTRLVALVEELNEMAVVAGFEPRNNLDAGLMGKAEVVHVTSHDIARFANLAQIRLNEGMATGDFDEEEITHRITMMNGVVYAISGLVNDIDRETPESHRNYADELKDEYDNLQGLIADLDQLTIEQDSELMVAILGQIRATADEIHDISDFIAGDEDSTDGADAPITGTDEGTAGGETQAAPGFGMLLAVFGLISMAYFARKN